MSKRKFKSNQSGPAVVKGIAAGIVICTAFTIGLAAILTVITQKQSIFEGIPSFIACAVPTIALSAALGAFLAMKISGGKNILVPLSVGLGYFMVLVAIHAGVSDGSQGVALSFGLCIGVPAAVGLLSVRTQTRGKKSFKI